jgi:hypothetical protein
MELRGVSHRKYRCMWVLGNLTRKHNENVDAQKQKGEVLEKHMTGYRSIQI